MLLLDFNLDLKERYDDEYFCNFLQRMVHLCGA